LFGAERGAYTGAHERRTGASSRRRAAACFWTKIGEIDPATQVKLLRFLGERTFERLGSNKTFTAERPAH